MATILLADDDEAIRAVYRACLQSAGHRVLEAADGRQALETFRQHRPELMILDVWMPELNGFEVLDALRHDSSSTRLKILMLSNLGDADTRLEAFNGGAMEYLVKGVPLNDLLGHVNALLTDDTLLHSDPS
jgi:DNA-binding response OmpR family regulator